MNKIAFTGSSVSEGGSPDTDFQYKRSFANRSYKQSLEFEKQNLLSPDMDKTQEEKDLDEFVQNEQQVTA